MRAPKYESGYIPSASPVEERFRPANNNGGIAGGLGEGLQGLAGATVDYAKTQDAIAAQNDDTQARAMAADARVKYAQLAAEYSTLQAGAARAKQQEFTDRANALREEALKGATNPRMRRMAEEALAAVHGDTVERISSHAIREQFAERKTTLAAEETSRVEAALLEPDPEKRDALIAGIRNARWEQTKLAGYDPENPEHAAIFQAEGLDATDKFHDQLVDRMFALPDPDVIEIGAYVAAYGDEMKPGTVTAIMARLQDPLQRRAARSDADSVMELAPPGESPVAGGGVVAEGKAGEVSAELTKAGFAPHVVAGFLGNFEVEGGYHGARGDGGTASGIAQWRHERRANFRRQFGKDPHDATAAEQAKFVVWEMNNPAAAGMTKGQRDQILAARDPAEAAALIDQFYERSDGKHRDRRKAEALRYSGGSGTAYAPTAREWDREKIYANLDERAAKEGWTEERRERARTEVDRRIGKDEGLLTEIRNEAEDAANEILAKNPDTFRTSMIPRNVWDTMTETQRAGFRSIEEKVHSPKEVEANGDTVIALSRMAITDQASFAKLNLERYRAFMTPGEFAQLADDQARASVAASKPGNVPNDRPKIDSAISAANKWGGINVDKDPVEGRRVRRFMETQAAEYRAKGKEPTAQDYDRWLRQATSETVVERTLFGVGIGLTRKRRAGAALSPVFRAQIIREFKQANGGKAPTEKQVQDIWESMGEEGL